MAGDENDGGWTALDDNIVGDGTVDGQTKPEDTMLENLVDVRHREMHERGPTETKEWYNPSGPESNPRPFTSRDESAIIAAIPWEVRPGLGEIHASVVGEVGCDDSNTTGEVELRLELIGLNERDPPFSETIATATGGITSYTITLDLSSRTIAPGIATLALFVKSKAEANTGDGTIFTSGDVGDETFIEIEGGASIDGELDEKSALSLSAFGSQVEGDGSALPLHKSTSVVGGEKRVGVKTILSSNSTTESGLSVPVLELSWIKPQSVAIQTTYDKTESAGSFVAKPPRAMEPQQAVKGADAATHPGTLDGIVRRPKIRAIGPHGQDQGVDWPTDYHRQWSWIATEDESDTELDRQTVRLKYGSSTLRCVAYVKPFFDIKITNDTVTQSDTVYQIAPQGAEGYGNYVITADLDLRVTLRQAQSSNTWPNQPSYSTTRTVQDISLHNARATPAYTLPNTVFWARHPQYIKSFANQYRWTHYEGVLFREDFSLLPRTGFSIEIDPSEAGSLVPSGDLRCDLEFAGWSQGPNTDEIDAPSGDVEFNYHLLCLGTSWWEVPQV